MQYTEVSKWLLVIIYICFPFKSWAQLPGMEKYPQMVFVKGYASKIMEGDETILKDFYIGKYEITISEFENFVLATGYKVDYSNYKDFDVADDVWTSYPTYLTWQNGNTFRLKASFEKSEPVLNISWEDAQAYCQWLSIETGHNYRLPTEAEWEFAAKGGNKSSSYIYAGSNHLYKVSWNRKEGKPNSVGSKLPNELGIYDMSGNAFEWTQDTFREIKEQKTVDEKLKVIKGGAWNTGNITHEISNRYSRNKNIHLDNIGFRVVREL